MVTTGPLWGISLISPSASKLPERLADRAPAHPHQLAELALDQATAGLEQGLGDRGAQAIYHLLADRSGEHGNAQLRCGQSLSLTFGNCLTVIFPDNQMIRQAASPTFRSGIERSSMYSLKILVL